MHGSSMLKLGVAAMAASLSVIPASAQAPGNAAMTDLEMLETLQRGNWALMFRSGEDNQRICVRTGREFIQIAHRQPGCDQFVIHDETDEVTVQYTCRGNGYGRTTIRRESNNLVQIDTQGIQGGAPFSMSGEARRIGAC